MKYRTTYILFGLLILAMGGLLIGVLVNAPKKGAARWLFPDEHPSDEPVKADALDVDSLQIERAGEKDLLFVRKDGVWSMAEPYKLRVQDPDIRKIVREVLDAEKQPGEPQGPGAHGLDPAKTIVTVKKDDKEWVLKLGDKSPKDTYIYALAGEKSKEVAVLKFQGLKLVFNSWVTFRDTSLLAESPSTGLRVEIQPGTGEDAKKFQPLSLEKDKTTSQWNYKEPNVGLADMEGKPGMPGDKAITCVRELLFKLGARVEHEKHFIAIEASDEKLISEYGLKPKAPETASIVLTTLKRSAGTGESAEKTDALVIGKKVLEPGTEKKTASGSGSASGTGSVDPNARWGYYAALQSEPGNVVWLAQDKVEPILQLMTNRDAVRSRELLPWLKETEVDAVQVKVTASGDQFQLLRSPELKRWRLDRTGKAPQKVEPRVVGELTRTLFEPRCVTSFPTTEKESGLTPPSADVRLWKEGVKEEKGSGTGSASGSGSGSASGGDKDVIESKLTLKDSDKPDVILYFGSTRDGMLYVKRVEPKNNDRTALLTIPAFAAEKVKAGVLDYLSREVPRFVAEEWDDAKAVEKVSKVTIERGSDSFTLAREKDGDNFVWKFSAPEDLKGRKAHEENVLRLIKGLRTPRVEKIGSEDTSNLEPYNLKPPALRAVVTVQTGDNKTDDYEYQFSKEIADKAEVYMTTNKRSVVFLVGKEMHKPFQEELIDSMITRVDIDQVKTIKLTRWDSFTNQASSITVERKAAQVYVPENMNLDGAKVERFLIDQFVPLRTSQHLYRTGPASGDKMFDIKENAIELEITFKGDAKPLVLTFGAPFDKGGMKGIHVKSSVVPNVFVLPEVPWKDALRGLDYFKKK